MCCRCPGPFLEGHFLGDHEIEGWVLPGEASGERVLVRSPNQSLSESEPRHRILTVQCRICLVSFEGKPTASQGPELFAEALMATEDQVNPGLSSSPGWQRFCTQVFISLFPIGARWFCGGFSVQAGDSL